MNNNWIQSFVDWYRENSPEPSSDTAEAVHYNDNGLVISSRLPRNYKKFIDVKEGDRLFHEGKNKVYTVESVVSTTNFLILNFKHEVEGKKFGGQVLIPHDESRNSSSFSYQYHKLFTSFYEYRDYTFNSLSRMLSLHISLLDDVKKVEEINTSYEQEMLNKNKEEFQKVLTDIRNHRIQNIVWYILSKCPNNKCVDTLLIQTVWLCDRMCLQRFGYVMSSESYKQSDLGPVNTDVQNVINSDFFEKSFADIVFKEGCPNKEEIRAEERAIMDKVIEMIANMTNNEITTFAKNSPENTAKSNSAVVSLPVMMRSYKNYKDIQGYEFENEQQYKDSLQFFLNNKEINGEIN